MLMFMLFVYISVKHKPEIKNVLSGRSPLTHFSTSVYLRDNAIANPLQGQSLYWMIIPHCLFILPAHVISSCWF